MGNENADEILDIWSRSLSSLDKSFKNTANNFDSLISELKEAKTQRKYAKELVAKAIDLYKPSRFIIDSTYKRSSFFSGSMTKEEYKAQWIKKIEDEAYTVFYSYYTREKTVEAMIGSMSRQEYMKQISYAKSHPDVNINDVLQKRQLVFGR